VVIREGPPVRAVAARAPDAHGPTRPARLPAEGRAGRTARARQRVKARLDVRFALTFDEERALIKAAHEEAAAQRHLSSGELTLLLPSTSAPTLDVATRVRSWARS
jgi:hypothetical protein